MPSLRCERCNSYKFWHDKQTHRTFLKPDGGKCLHDYFYFIDEELGLSYLRVPTWCPFRLQFYFNGHNWLARQLDKKRIGDTLLDNAFRAIDDWDKAQQLIDRFDVRRLLRRLDKYGARFCPVGKTFGENYYWSRMEMGVQSDLKPPEYTVEPDRWYIGRARHWSDVARRLDDRWSRPTWHYEFGSTLTLGNESTLAVLACVGPIDWCVGPTRGAGRVNWLCGNRPDVSPTRGNLKSQFQWRSGVLNSETSWWDSTNTVAYGDNGDFRSVPSNDPISVPSEQRRKTSRIVFTPWHALAEHQPLGSINRLRYAVYVASSKHRLALQR